MAEKHDGTIMFEGAKLIFLNFSGKEGQYNRAGDRNFCVLLDPELAATLAEDGWNVKTLRAREEGDEPQQYLQVSVGYKGRPPTIVQISSSGRVHLGEDEVEVLDWVDILNADLIVRPYNWEVSGKTGVKAYLKSLYVTIEEDELARKYAPQEEDN